MDPKPVRLWKRTAGKQPVYYYRIYGQELWKSTGTADKVEAKRIAKEKLEEWLAAGGPTVVYHHHRPPSYILSAYLKPYYTQKCPHVLRLRNEGKSIGNSHIERCRVLLDTYVLPDMIAALDIRRIRRANLIDFRERLKGKAGLRTVNRIMSTLKTIFAEALFREDIDRNPCQGIGQIKYEPRKRGIFTEKELAALFPREGIGPWYDLRTYCAFMLAASLGMRRGEVLALQWQDLDFDNHVISIRRAIKEKEIGLPKWNKTRVDRLPESVVVKLKELRAESYYVLPGAFVFCDETGKHMGPTWFTWQFRRTMDRAGLDWKARSLSPHSLRHTCNTLLASKGVDLEKIRASKGWSSIEIQRGYTHFGPNDFIDQAAVFDRLWK